MPECPQDMTVQEQAAWWLLRHQEGQRDEPAWQAWLALGAGRQAAYDGLVRTWQALDAVPAEAIPAGWRPAPATRRKGASAWWAGGGGARAAIGAVALCTVVGLSWLIHAQWTAPVYQQHFSTVRGQTLQVRLPDGSELWLDAASEVDVRYHRQHRDVDLQGGQAQFKVQPDASRPFHVQAAQARVTVVGTEFTVRHLAGQVEVAVLHGLVRVDSLNPQASWSHLLRATQVVRADEQGLAAELGTQPVAEMAAWRQGRIVFNNTPLDQALAEFGRYVPVSSWRLADPSLASLRVTGSFDASRADSFLGTLPHVLPVRVVTNGSGRDIVRR